MTRMLITTASGVKDEKITLMILSGAKIIFFTYFDLTIGRRFKSTQFRGLFELYWDNDFILLTTIFGGN